MESKETSGEKRERLRQKELKNNPTGSLRDGFDRSSGSWDLQNITGDMGWKGMALLILLLFLGYVIYRFFLVENSFGGKELPVLISVLILKQSKEKMGFE